MVPYAIVWVALKVYLREVSLLPSSELSCCKSSGGLLISFLFVHSNAVRENPPAHLVGPAQGVPNLLIVTLPMTQMKTGVWRVGLSEKLVFLAPLIVFFLLLLVQPLGP